MNSKTDFRPANMSFAESTQNPYAPPALDTADDPYVLHTIDPTINPNTYWKSIWDTLLVISFAGIAVVGVPLAFHVMDSIVGSAFALLVPSSLLLIRERVCRRRGRPRWSLGLFLACSTLLFVAVLTSVIALNEWSPDDAKKYGVQWVVAAFGVWTVLLSIAAYYTRPKKTELHEG